MVIGFCLPYLIELVDFMVTIGTTRRKRKCVGRPLESKNRVLKKKEASLRITYPGPFLVRNLTSPNDKGKGKV